MSLAEALGEGLQVTVIGLIIVFSVLIILMLVMMLMKVIFYKPQNDAKTAQKPPAPAPAPVSAAPAPAPAVQNSVDEGELVAVLTAAIAASLNTSTYHLNIKSYRRIENTSPAWNKAGLRDVIDARF